MGLFAYVSDPTLPCPYCCGWKNVDPDDINSDAYPIHADGTRIAELSDVIHPECQQMVNDYLAERDVEGLNL